MTVKVVSFLFELPTPTQNIIALSQPRDQTLVFNHVGIAIHTLGIATAIGETAIQTELVILPLMQERGFFLGFVHNLNTAG